MWTVNEVSKMSGVSIRTLQYYDRIGLLKPKGYTEAGYRLYDDMSMERLQQILFFKELEFSLREIKAIIDTPKFNKVQALEEQIKLLKMKKERLEGLISFAKKIKFEGGKYMDFTVFDKTKIDNYAKIAREKWGDTKEYAEYEERKMGKSSEEQRVLLNNLMDIFVEFGELLDKEPCDAMVQNKVKKLQDYITEHFYKCSKDILKGLGKMYGCDGEFKVNIDKWGGDGTALFVAKAIEIYCQ